MERTKTDGCIFPTNIRTSILHQKKTKHAFQCASKSSSIFIYVSFSKLNLGHQSRFLALVYCSVVHHFCLLVKWIFPRCLCVVSPWLYIYICYEARLKLTQHSPIEGLIRTKNDQCSVKSLWSSFGFSIKTHQRSSIELWCMTGHSHCVNFMLFESNDRIIETYGN